MQVISIGHQQHSDSQAQQPGWAINPADLCRSVPAYATGGLHTRPPCRRDTTHLLCRAQYQRRGPVSHPCAQAQLITGLGYCALILGSRARAYQSRSHACPGPLQGAYSDPALSPVRQAAGFRHKAIQVESTRCTKSARQPTQKEDSDDGSLLHQMAN